MSDNKKYFRTIMLIIQIKYVLYEFEGYFLSEIFFCAIFICGSCCTYISNIRIISFTVVVVEA